MHRENSFRGFPAETFLFLTELEQNNASSWFNSRREVFEQVVMEPAQAFIEAFGEDVRRIYPELIYDTRRNGAGSMFRMNRDIRFSKDKSPYKTNLGFRFWLTQADRANKRVQLYVNLDKSGIRVYGGSHCQAEADALFSIREAIVKDSEGKLRQLLDRLSASGFESYGEEMARVPRGFSPEHPNADLLRRKSMLMGSPIIGRDIAETNTLIKQSASYAEALKSLNDWLKAILPSQAAKRSNF